MCKVCFREQVPREHEEWLRERRKREKVEREVIIQIEAAVGWVEEEVYFRRLARRVVWMRAKDEMQPSIAMFLLGG